MTDQLLAQSVARWFLVSICFAAKLLSPTQNLNAQSPTGEVLYQRHCVSCHGPQGDGTPEHYPYVLAGDRTVSQLALFIGKSMPPDQPGVLDADSVRRVAAYIHEAFYSPEVSSKRLAAIQLEAVMFFNANDKIQKIRY